MLAVAAILFLIVIALTPSRPVGVMGRQVERQVIHVASTGSAAGDGSAQRPYRELQQAIDAVAGPARIEVGSGLYAAAIISGRTDIEIVGSAGTTFSDGAYDRRAALRIVGSQNIRVSDLQVRTSLVGVLVESSAAIELVGLEVHDVGQEGIHIRYNSNDVLVADSIISLTGQRPGSDDRFPYSKYGEGVYIGTGTGDPDYTRDVHIRDNDISRTTAEAIDIKPRTSDIVVEWNDIHDIETNTSGAVVVGIGPLEYGDPNVIIRSNLLWNISTSSPYSDGNAVTVSAPATVEANVIIGTKHFGVLTDGNFGTSRAVELRNNVITATGRDPIGSWNEPNGAIVSLDGNLTGSAAEAVLGPSPISGGTPTAAAYSLRADLADGPSATTTTSTVPASTTSTTLPAETTSSTTSGPTTTSVSVSETTAPGAAPTTTIGRNQPVDPVAVAPTATPDPLQPSSPADPAIEVARPDDAVGLDGTIETGEPVRQTDPSEPPATITAASEHPEPPSVLALAEAEDATSRGTWIAFAVAAGGFVMTVAAAREMWRQR